MKRNSIALLIQPFKNSLLPRKVLRESIDTLFKTLLSLASDFPHLRFNVVLPGYVLECVNTLLLSQLRDLYKKGNLEWLLPGYTEPFMSMSPPSLTDDNIRYGLKVFSELTNDTPAGFMPGFSNWEPACIENLRGYGINYVVLSSDLLPLENRGACGYWVTEHAGTSIPVIPTSVVHHSNAPADFINWVEKIFNDDKSQSVEKFTAVQYLIPLRAQNESDPYRWLTYAAGEIDKHILNYQCVKFSEHLAAAQPLGFQYIPPSLSIGFRGEAGRHFLNDLHSYDQIGLLQRKMMDVYDQISSVKDPKMSGPLKRELFFLQDINRYLPGKECGFENYTDRMWSFSKLIEIERALHEKSEIKGGRIRITDFLRNGGKCIILSNKNLKVYIDYKNGGQIFEIDHRERSLNLCAAYNPIPHSMPGIIMSGKSRTWFADRILAEETRGWDYTNGPVDYGNFISSQFEYKIKTSSSNVKTILVKPGSVLRGDRNYPLNMEKVFSLEQDGSTLSFVYQLTNPSLMEFGFKFATELTLSLPGALTGDLRVVQEKNRFEKVGAEFFQLESITKWYIEDRQAALRIQFETQKPIDVWFIPSSSGAPVKDEIQGVTVVLSSSVKLEKTSNWKLIGKAVFRRLRKKGDDPDAV